MAPSCVHSLTAATVACLVAASGCQGGFNEPDPTEDAEAMLDMWGAQSQEYCVCFWAIWGFSSPEGCTGAYSPSTLYRECFRTAYANHSHEAGATMECYLAVEGRRLECLRNARCDSYIMPQCDEMAWAELGACPGYIGGAYEQVLNERDLCVIGVASGCPDRTSTVGTVGAAVITATTEGMGDDTLGSCTDGGDSADYSFQFTAPQASTYRIDTEGSTIDTVLYVLESCLGPEIACNDDIAFDEGVYTSAVEITLAAGQTVVVVVDGYWLSDYGPFMVNITPDV